jgi:hypothetical protein
MSNNQSTVESPKIKSEKRSRFAYYRRVFSAYLGKGNSHLTFWHGAPRVNENASVDQLGEYYMPFLYKANYPGPFDDQGIPLLDYHGKVSLQYNPIAIAQYALAHYNLFARTNEQKHFDIFLKQVDWLVSNLEMNPKGLYVWNHHFDWEYREVLKDPWYSALAQGQGISALVRAYRKTGQESYMEAAQRAFETFKYGIRNGGVKYTDDKGYVWLEEAIVEPPTHILNGFIWSLWGIYDYYLVTHDADVKQLFDNCVATLKGNLATYDIDFWSLYEHSGTRLKMIASPFSHSLHIVQLRVMYRLTDEEVFKEFAQRWTRYRQNWLYRKASLVYKLVFKLVYY